LQQFLYSYKQLCGPSENGFDLSSSLSLVIYLSCDLENHFSLEL